MDDIFNKPLCELIDRRTFLKMGGAAGLSAMLAALAIKPSLAETIITDNSIKVDTFWPTVSVETLAATKTLVVTDDIVQWLDPGGADRTVTLPAEASSTNLLFIILNTANGAGEDLIVKNAAAATIATLGPGMCGIFSCDGTNWKQGNDVGITYDSVSGTNGFGDNKIIIDNPQKFTNVISGSSGYLMVYNGEGSAYKIGLAVSQDGFDFIKTNNLPIISPVTGTWENSHTKDPYLLKVMDTYYLYYTGFGATGINQIGLATSKDTITWTKYAGNPVLTFADTSSIHRFPVIIYDADESDLTKKWKMWYNINNTTLGYAYSPDGITWTKYAGNPVLSIGAGGQWDDSMILTGTLFKQGDVWSFYYGGQDGSKWHTGVATFTNPESTYTKSSNNPLVSGKSTATAALTADLNTGTKTVTVGDTSLFVQNEYVFLDDDDSVPELNRIKSIDSATQLTLRDNVAASFTTAQNAFIRSVYYASLTPRSILIENGKYVMYATAFQVLSDLRELSVVFSSDNLDSDWTIDIDKGVILQFGSVWDTISAENPSVIPYYNEQLFSRMAFLETLETLQNADIEANSASFDILGLCTNPKFLNLICEDPSSGTMIDVSTAGHNGTYNGSMTTDDRVNKGIGWTIDPDGVDDYISLGDSDDFSFGDGSSDIPFTIAGVVEVVATGSAQSIIAKRDDTTGSELREWFIGFNNAHSLYVAFWDESANVNCYVLSDAALSVGWHTFVVTYTGAGGATAANGIKLYVDGALIANTPTNNGSYVAMENLTTPVYIGAYIHTDGNSSAFLSGDYIPPLIDTVEWGAMDAWRYHLRMSALYNL